MMSLAAEAEGTSDISNEAIFSQRRARSNYQRVGVVIPSLHQERETQFWNPTTKTTASSNHDQLLHDILLTQESLSARMTTTMYPVLSTTKIAMGSNTRNPDRRHPVSAATQRSKARGERTFYCSP